MNHGFDTPDTITHDVDLSGFDFVGRYYSNSAWKRLTAAEVKVLKEKGVAIVVFYEDGPTAALYFTPSRGAADSVKALNQAKECGQPVGTPIYFTVDYDALHSDLPRILAYAAAVHGEVKAAGYAAGWYGSGLVLRAIMDAGLGSYFALAQSTGWQGYEQFKASGKWNILQGQATKLQGLNVDMDESNGDGGGW